MRLSDTFPLLLVLANTSAAWSEFGLTETVAEAEKIELTLTELVHTGSYGHIATAIPVSADRTTFATSAMGTISVIDAQSLEPTFRIGSQVAMPPQVRDGFAYDFALSDRELVVYGVTTNEDGAMELFTLRWILDSKEEIRAKPKELAHGDAEYFDGYLVFQNSQSAMRLTSQGELSIVTNGAQENTFDLEAGALPGLHRGTNLPLAVTESGIFEIHESGPSRVDVGPHDANPTPLIVSRSSHGVQVYAERMGGHLVPVTLIETESGWRDVSDYLSMGGETFPYVDFVRGDLLLALYPEQNLLVYWRESAGVWEEVASFSYRRPGSGPLIAPLLLSDGETLLMVSTPDRSIYRTRLPPINNGM